MCIRDSLLGVLRRARGSFVIVTNEFGVVQGLVTPLDVLEAIAGEFPDADETPEIITDGDGWLVKGGTDLHALQQALDVEHLADDDDIATVAGLVISANGHIPRVGDVIDVGPLHKMCIRDRPCIERNAIASVKAINAARMALRRTSAPRVSLDKVIETMYETGKDMNAKYRETSRGGLAIKVQCD